MIKNKRGLSYIDWIVSMGLFIIVIIALFAFLKPGVKPVYESSGLINIVESSFFENSSWNVKNTPIIIYQLTREHPSPGGPRPSKIELKHDGTPNKNWTFSSYFIDPSIIGNFNITFSGSRVTLNCKFSACKTTSSKQIYITSYDPEEKDPFEVQVKCTPNDKTYCNMETGASEEIEGINNKMLNKLRTSNYDDIKKSWNYPNEKDFTISIYNINTRNTTKILNPTNEPPIEANVFVKEVNTWIVNNKGEREPVKVNIRVW